MGNGKRNRTGGGRSEEEVGVGEEAGHMKMDGAWESLQRSKNAGMAGEKLEHSSLFLF